MPFSVARPSRPYAGRDFHWLPDIDKIRSELGYEDQVPPHEGMRRAVTWYLENRPEANGEIEGALDDPFDYAAEDMLIERYELLIHQNQGRSSRQDIIFIMPMITRKRSKT